MAGPTILLSAGEPSGDLHGSGLVRALKRRWPDACLLGLGGPRMQAEGFQALAEFERLAVMGFVEVAAQLPFFLGLLRRVEAELDAAGVDLVIPIDYPGFNLRLAKAARARSIPVLYYIAPQVWAWHRSRMAELARNTDRIAVILPFEAELLRQAGADAHFVGHPLLDLPEPVDDGVAFRAGLDVPAEAPLLALFPGSRAQEVKRHLAPFVGAAERVRAERRGVQPVIATSTAVPSELYDAAPYPTTGDSRALLRHARAALVKSGTTTLETALALTPMVIAYRTHPLTFWLARRLVEVEHIGLVNLVAGERLVPELLQDDVEPHRLADALLRVLDEGPERERVLAGLRGVRARLEAPGEAASAADRVAALAGELLG